MIIKLVRHGESQHNTGERNAQIEGDHTIELTDLGVDQARDTGIAIGGEYVTNALLYTSPYTRTRQTMLNIIDASDSIRFSDGRLLYYEDLRLREMERGYHKDTEQMDTEESQRETFGWIYYRFEGGESPADVHDRVTSFIDSLHRQLERKRKTRALIVTHGVTLRCFVMRWFHLSPEQYHLMRNPDNCNIVTISDKSSSFFRDNKPQFERGRWAVSGLKFRENQTEPAPDDSHLKITEAIS